MFVARQRRSSQSYGQPLAVQTALTQDLVELYNLGGPDLCNSFNGLARPSSGTYSRANAGYESTRISTSSASNKRSLGGVAEARANFITVAMLVKPTTDVWSSFAAICSLADASNNGVVTIQETGGALGCYFDNTNFITSGISPGSFLPGEVWTFIAISFDGGNCYFYKNGSRVAVQSGFFNSTPTPDHWNIGNERTASIARPGDYAYLARWQRKLTDGEHAQLADDPWALFQPLARYLPVPALLTFQESYPASDVTTASWTSSLGGSLFAAIDETIPDDSDYVFSPDNPTTQEFEVKFGSLINPGVTTNHTLRYRVAAVGQDTTFTMTLVCGTTTIASWSDTVTVGTTTTFEKLLTSLQASSITDYTDLRLRGKAGP